MLILGTKPKKHDPSSNSVSDDQHDKSAHIGIKKESISDGGHGSNVHAGSAHIKAGSEWEPLINIRNAKSDSGCSLPQVQSESSNGAHPKTRSSKMAPAASHSPDQPELELINPPDAAKCDTDW